MRFVSVVWLLVPVAALQPTTRRWALGALATAPGAAWGAGEAMAVFSAGDPRFLQPIFDELKYRGVLRCDTGKVGGVAAIRVRYDPAKCSYKQLLGAYWRNVDPTQVNQQFPLSSDEVGPGFRGVVWVASDEERRFARVSMAKLEASGIYKQPFRTEILDLADDFEATPELDDFAALNPREAAKLALKSGRTKFFEDAYKPTKTTACEGGVCGFVTFPCSAENGCLEVVSGAF